MKIKHKLVLLPYIVILMVDMAVMVVFIMHFFNINNNQAGTVSLHYLFLIFLMSLVIFALRMIIIGKGTILDSYLTRVKNDYLFIFFVSFIVSILVTTWLIKYFSINYFLNVFVQDSQFSPIKWFDILNSNFHQVTFYALIFVLINSVVLFLFFKIKDYSHNKNLRIKDETWKNILLAVMVLEIFLFVFLFMLDPMIFLE